MFRDFRNQWLMLRHLRLAVYWGLLRGNEKKFDEHMDKATEYRERLSK